MATYYVSNSKEVNELIYKSLVPQLMEFLGKKTMNVMKGELGESELSTTSLQNSIFYKLENNKRDCVIYIDYDYALTEFGEPASKDENGNLIEWGRFHNALTKKSFNGQFWNGEPVTYIIAHNLETQTSNLHKIGNNPLKPSHWFTNTQQIVERNLQNWTREFFKAKGYIK